MRVDDELARDAGTIVLFGVFVAVLVARPPGLLGVERR